MYPRPLGVVAAPCDPFGNQGLMPEDPGYNPNLVYDPAQGCWFDTTLGPVLTDPSSLVPTVTQTVTYSQPPIAPVSPQGLPVTLPDLVAVAPAPGASTGLWVVLGLLAAWGLSKGGGLTRSW